MTQTPEISLPDDEPFPQNKRGEVITTRALSHLMAVLTEQWHCEERYQLNVIRALYFVPKNILNLITQEMSLASQYRRKRPSVISLKRMALLALDIPNELAGGNLMMNVCQSRKRSSDDHRQTD